ncbi:MAG: hypothetical protein K8R54_09700 [Bacteroidales bacterium]|nr:hypothetical protein [Bacteroidales bacterium]
MIRKFKKQISLLFAGSFSMVLAACYGMPIDMQIDRSVKVVNELNEAIPGLQVKLTNNGERVYEDLSDDSGYVYYSSLEENNDNDYKVIINDIDSTENGGIYISQVVDIVEYEDEYVVIMNK